MDFLKIHLFTFRIRILELTLTLFASHQTGTIGLNKFSRYLNHFFHKNISFEPPLFLHTKSHYVTPIFSKTIDLSKFRVKQLLKTILKETFFI